MVNNTIISPENWVVRILQETVDPNRFFQCGDNSFQNNLIFLGNIATEINIGPDTRPASFLYSSNFWYNYENPNWQGPNTPVIDPTQIINKDPLFQNVAGMDFTPQVNSPALSASDYAGEPLLDYNGNGFNSPRSVGAIEGNPVTGLQHDNKSEGAIFCSIKPNPFNSLSIFQYRIRFFARTRLRIYDISGRKLAELVNSLQEPGDYSLAFDPSDAATGVYLYELINGSDRIYGKITLLR